MNTKKSYANLSTILFATLLIFAATSTAWARSLTGVTVEWAPHYGSALQDNGALTVITKRAFERAGYEVDIQFIAWKRAMKNVEEGQDDFIMGAYYNDERGKAYYVSDPVYSVNIGLMALESLGFNKLRRLTDLKPYTIGVTLGYAQTPEFDSAEFLHKETAPSPKLNMRKLYRKRVDLVAGSFDVLRYEAKIENLETRRLVAVEPPLQSNKLYIMVSRAIPDGEQLVADFNRELANMRQDGSLDTILKTYLAR